MPIFMDRHEIAGATAEDVADAHRKDLELQDQYGVKFLTYWFDDRRGTTFCLVDAPSADAVQCVHRDAHGHIPGEIVEVSLSAVEAFLGRVHDPQPVARHSPALAEAAHRAILFTDIVDSTGITQRLGDVMTTELIRAHDSVVRRCLKRFGGQEIKHTGDGIMASFPQSKAAVDASILIQQEFGRYNANNPEPIHVRIGLDCGEPVEDSNDLFGRSVQLAARLCSCANSDQIIASENIYREDGRLELFGNPIARELKGFSKAVPSFECVWAANP
jgi:class 3 adenylate cyclase